MEEFDPSEQERLQEQTHRELLLVLLVCAVALAAMLSVFVPALRRFWLAIANLLVR